MQSDARDKRATRAKPRHRVRRQPARASYEREVIEAILDEALICHVGIFDAGYPVVTPTLHARVGDSILIHGSTASRTMRRLAEGAEACVAVSLIDGLVLARSAVHHSVNYRSVLLFGRAEAVSDAGEKLRALEAIVERFHPGRWSEVRSPSALELKATAVVRMPIEEASAKVREGPPVDEEADYALDAWAGVIPMRLQAMPAVPDPRLRPGIPPPPEWSSPPTTSPYISTPRSDEE